MPFLKYVSFFNKVCTCSYMQLMTVCSFLPPEAFGYEKAVSTPQPDEHCIVFLFQSVIHVIVTNTTPFTGEHQPFAFALQQFDAESGK
jgi:hypothetical protein